MSLPRWDDEMKFELLRLKSELRPENFRVLHQPLGLGAVRVDAVQASPSPQQAPAAQPRLANPWLGAQSDVRSTSLSRGTATQPPPTLLNADGLQKSLAKAQRSWLASTTRLTLVHILDLSFVCLCLSLGLILLSWVVDPQLLGFDLEKLKQASPLQFLQNLQTVALILGVYTAFVLYWIFFKVVSGSTLGETCIDLMKQTETRGTAAPINGSGDS